MGEAGGTFEGGGKGVSIGVIVPCYNGGRFLRDLVQSLQSQTFSDWECVIVDDGSTDDSRQIGDILAASDSRIIMKSQNNKGMAEARNAGYEASNPTNKYLLFIDVDDKLMPDALETLWQAIESRPSLVAVYGSSRSFGETPRSVNFSDLEGYARKRLGYRNGKITQLSVEDDLTFPDMLIRNWIITPGQALIRRAAYHQIGGFDQSVFLAADWDMWIRLTRKGPINFVDKTVLLYRLHETNGSRSKGLMERQALAVRYKAVASSENNSSERLVAVRLLRRHLIENVHSRAYWAAQSLSKGDLLGCARQLWHTLRPLFNLMGFAFSRLNLARP
jgi:glycosyltransferase involved in cell wall biosynthesis